MARRCCSSVVEHSLGKGEVESSIPSSSTNPVNHLASSLRGDNPNYLANWRGNPPRNRPSAVI
jgi:hypothetical protein